MRPSLFALLIAASDFFPTGLPAQNQSPCPAPAIADTARLVLVARLLTVDYYRPPAFMSDGRPTLGGSYVALVYDSATYLHGSRGDLNRDLYSELPELGGIRWEVGQLYLLVLAVASSPPLDSRTIYRTSKCYGTQRVASVAEARDIYSRLGYPRPSSPPSPRPAPEP